MASTPARNISYPDPTSGYNPPVDWANTANSVENALVESANYGVGTTAEMNAAVSRFPDGAMWYNTTNDTEYRRVSGAWVVESQDTGWVPITLPSGYSAVPVAQVRKYANGQIQLRGRIDKNSGNFVGNDSIGFLPEGFRPDILDRYDLSGSSGSRVQVTILTDGEIRILNPVPPATTGLVFLGGIVLS